MSDDAHLHEIEEENYFVSMTDMMVGLIFIFVIMLMYFALQLRQTTDDLTSADETRTQILQEVQRSLQASGINVKIDTENGILRLPEAILFASGRWQLSPEGVPIIEKVADALWTILPCFSEVQDGTIRPSASCPPDNTHQIEAIFIEGHTDDVGVREMNWTLSAQRAISTYQAITLQQSRLADLCSRKRSGACEPILSVSGYADSRPVEDGRLLPGDTEDDITAKRARNRRIDIRILMKAPLDPTVRTPIESEIDARP